MTRIVAGMVVPLAAFLSIACAALAPGGSDEVTSPAHVQGGSTLSALAGEWEYEEGSAVIPLMLDDQGTGTYPYKGGRLLTTSLIDSEWRGRWIQTENDREGEFVVHLTADLTEGDGHWWYTRIGAIPNPPDKGGLFHVSRTGLEPAPLSRVSASLP